MGKICSLPEHSGTWLEYSAAKAEDLILLPSLVPPEQLALGILNPLTAWRLLNDFEYLRPDDWIVQNAANSAVGTSVVQFAKRLGVNVINLVRREELQKPLNELGAKHVLLDDEDSSCRHSRPNRRGRLPSCSKFSRWSQRRSPREKPHFRRRARHLRSHDGRASALSYAQSDLRRYSLRRVLARQVETITGPRRPPKRCRGSPPAARHDRDSPPGRLHLRSRPISRCP